MATLQKIRNRGKILIFTVGLALFAFIAEEFVRSLSYTQTERHQRVGKIYGDKINVQEFNAQVEEYTDVVKFTQGVNTLSDDQLSMMRDQVWQTLVNDKVMQHECEKLGITVTDAEMQDIINNGRNPMLAQTPFRTAQGTFDVNALKQFLNQYNEVMTNPDLNSEIKEQYQQMNNYWKFIEKTIRRQTLNNKYQALLNGLMVSNPVAAQASFDGRTNETDIYMAALPFTSIKDDDVKVEDSELKAKYEELKELFRTEQETRDIKYIDINVTASDADKANLQKEMEGYAQALAEGADPAKTVREAASQVPYSVLPISAKALPHDIAEKLDSMGVGAQVGPFVHEHDNTINIVRLIGKVSLPDSVEVRQIAAPGNDMAAIEKTADSIMNALAAGANFDTIAKKYDQPATKTWITSSQYEGQSIDENNRKFISTISNAAVGSYNKIVLDGQGVIITQVTDRRNIVSKYDVAVIKRAMDFSKETYGKAYNDFSSFLAGNPKAEDIEANAAQAGYTVQTRNNLSSTEHNVANVRSTRDALRWIFDDKTKVGDVSPLYECGDNDHMLVITLTGIHKKGYLPWDDEQIRTFLTGEVMKDKKAAMLQEKLKGVKSIADVAKIEGAVTDTIHHITFMSNAFVSKIGASEPALSGSVSKAKKGDFKSGIKGKAAVYAYQVLDQKKTEEKFDKKAEEQRLQQSVARSLGNFQGELMQDANISDKRYIFF
ncbi:MAG: SurA N-terminal domain-containing protein [Bacteroidaceae bacterium]|nr:SurA N-terminal domain-containing protein [Bacteroidaceae bacterium]